jgi:hypothetical protein
MVLPLLFALPEKDYAGVCVDFKMQMLQSSIAGVA